MKTNLSITLDPTRRAEASADFEASLRRKIVGQDSAVEKIVELYQKFTAGLNPTDRPVGNFLFLGPTGTGKTRTVESVAEALYGDSRACIKIDCAEFQHSHEIAKIIGSPPGYLGHRETHPMITQEVLNQWHTERMKVSVLLFDEIEKASDTLWQLLLGILDKGRLTLGDNRRVDLTQCLIFMTSNVGATAMNDLLGQGNGLGFAKAMMGALQTEERLAKTATEAARKKFSPEFINRIDYSVVFNTLTDAHLQKILELELGFLQQRILRSTNNKQFVFSLTEPVKRLLLEEGTDTRYGARHLKRAIERHLAMPFANLVATGQISLGDFVRVRIEDGKVRFVKEATNVLTPVSIDHLGTEAAIEAAVKNGRARRGGGKHL